MTSSGTRSVFIYLLIRFIVYCLLLSVTLSAFSQPQPYYFKHYNDDQGLVSPTVTSVCQDQQGFIWVGTAGGVYRFDGYRFRLFTFSGKSPFVDQWVLCLLIDHNGVLWVGTFSGLFYFDRKQEKLIQAPIPPQGVMRLTEDNKGNLWVICEKQFYRYNVASKKLVTYSSDRWFHASAVNIANDGSIWMYSIDRVLRKYNSDKQTFTAYNLHTHSSPAISLIQHAKILNVDKDKFLIASENEPLKLFDRKTGSYRDIFIYNSDKSRAFIKDVIQYGSDEFWIATETGIFIYSLKNGVSNHLYKQDFDSYALSDNAVYALCKDREGGVWAGTFFGGLNYYSPRHAMFKKYYRNASGNSITGNVVREICEDRYGSIWMGTEDGGLNKLAPETGIIQQFKSDGAATSISYPNIHGLLATGDDLWIGTFFNGINVLDIRTGKVRKRYRADSNPGNLNADFAVCFYKTHANELLIGSDFGTSLYLPQSDRFQSLAGVFPTALTKCILEDHSGRIWIGTAGSGLYCFTSNKKKIWHYTNESVQPARLPVTSVNALMEDHAKCIWVSLEGGGVLVLDSNGRERRHYTFDNILPSNIVYKTVEDNECNVWITTDKGLVCIRQNEQSFLYTKADGLLDDHFNYNSGYKDQRGQLYFGSLKGMISFFPNQLNITNAPIKLYITGFQQGTQELPVGLTSSFKLLHNRSTFSIDFAALNYSNPEAVRYAYKMEGLDTGWTNLKKNRKVYFTSLSPGKYTFRVKAVVNGSSNVEERQLTIEVTPPWYATKWAYWSYFLVLIAVVIVVVNSYRHKVQVRRERAIYHANMDFFTNIAHEIKTPLMLIEGPVASLLEKTKDLSGIQTDVSILSRGVKRLMSLITNVLDFRRLENRHFRIVFARVNVSGILKNVYNDFLPQFRKLGFSVQIDPVFETDIFIKGDAEALYRIFSNLFSNAAKYGNNAFFIKVVSFLPDKNELVIEFMNDGMLIAPEMRERIFTPFYRLKQHEQIAGSGIGLSLAQSMAELHGGRLQLSNSRSEYNTFILTLPLK